VFATPFVAFALLALAVLLVVLSAVTAIERGRSIRRDRRRREAEATAKRQVLRVLAGDGPVLQSSQSRELESVAASLLPKLRGEDRDALVAFLDGSGALDRARAELSQRGAVRRARAAELLGAASDTQALPRLIELLDDRDGDVRIVAARALGKLGPPAVAPLLGALDARRPIPGAVVTMALVHVGPDAAEPLTEALVASSSSRARVVAAELLGRLSAFGAAAPLRAALVDGPDDHLRAAAAHALGRIGLAGSIPALLAQVEHTGDRDVRLACIGALGDIGGPAALSALPVLLADPDHRVARRAAVALASCGTPGRRILERSTLEPQSAAPAREQLARLSLKEAARTPRRRSGRAA
jgi:HEAT repeat protein